MTVALNVAAEPDPQRSCGSCTACCAVLAVVELRKPMRCACPHQAHDGCRIYADRPASCRQFNCLWLRGGLPADEAWRPDRLGVLFDSFTRATDDQPQLTALEVFPDVFASETGATLLRRIVDDQQKEMTLSYRDGRIARLVPSKSPCVE
ncbi:MAG TPA: hypothetical protein VM165_07010 [Planctomycetaceae bacterium]|nr:hypothetical protein [Planctomycetaceae bacterium]